MHSVGIHSALAIKRQRKRRDEQKRARERRYSIQSTDSGDTNHSPHGSTRWRNRFGSHPQTAGKGFLDTKVVTSIGMLHIGVVFLVFGIFLLGAGILPDDMSTFNLFASETWYNELVFIGFFAVGLGIFLIVLNCIISKREEDDLEEYVHRQLTRSRSGHRLERDVETGGLTTRHYRKAQQMQKENSDNYNLSQSNATPVTSEVATPTTPPGDLGASGDMLLEQIVEEDISYGYGEDERHRVMSPRTHHDKKYLFSNGHNGPNYNMTNI